ncbi:MAG TPA: AMP-binding protein [Acidimicrobiales bacterium]|nr:AMP-binding protein [Acidimicrobiales bacterium]
MPELVALDLPGGAGFVDAVRAIWDTGDAVAPLDPRLPLPARAALMAALRPSRVVGSDGQIHVLPDGLPVEEGDALVMATSGSSGQPKGVVHTHEALLASARATTRQLGVDPQRHSWLACLPLAHIGGFSVVTRALLTDTPLTVVPSFDPEQVEALGRSGRISHVSLVATALGRIDPSVFVGILLGGSKPPNEIPNNVVTTYGMTETGSGVVYDGHPLEGVTLAIDNGQILVRGPMLMRAYRDGDTGRVSGPDGSGDWLATGDAGLLSDTGMLHVTGRLAEVIVSGGEKIWPDAVERVLAAHPGVQEVAVWKRPDPEWGERVVAWVVPVPHLDQPDAVELKELVAASLAPWAAPKEVVFVDALPRTASGKVRRRDLT